MGGEKKFPALSGFEIRGSGDQNDNFTIFQEVERKFYFLKESFYGTGTGTW
jgi:hypothetical protein